MNKLPFFRPSLAAACLAAVASFSAVAALAQAEATSASTPAEPPPGYSAKKFDLNITQSSVQNLAELLRKQEPGLNVVLGPGVGEFVIRDLKLHNADLNTLLRALEVATDGAIRGNLGPARRGGGFGDAGSATLMLMRGGPSNNRQVEVFNLTGYLRRGGNAGEAEVQKRVDDLQAIIVETIRGMREGVMPKASEPPRFVFHPGANLFIVIGSADDIDVARKVVTALQGPGGRGGGGGVAPTPGQPAGTPGRAGNAGGFGGGSGDGSFGGGGFGSGDFGGGGFGGFGGGAEARGRGGFGGFGGAPPPAEVPAPAGQPAGAATGSSTNR